MGVKKKKRVKGSSGRVQKECEIESVGIHGWAARK